MVRSAVLVFGFLLAVFGNVTATAATGNDSVFEKALHAARNDDWDTLASTEQQLPDDHPLRAYLDFHKLRGALPQLDPKRIQAFARRYPDSPLPDDIRQLALVAYAKAQRWDDARTLYDSPPRPVELRCYYLQAQLPVDRNTALDATRKLWLSGGSRPSSCDPLFDAARQAGVIGEDEIWHRMRLAFHDRSTGLMRYLQPMLDSHEQAGEWLLKLYRDPNQVDNLPTDIGNPQRQQLVALALRRLAYTDTVEARKRFQHAREQLGLTDPVLRKHVATRIAWYSTIRDIDDNRDWLDDWLANSNDQNLIDQRARLAITEQDWKALPDWIQRLSPQAQKDSRWLYWRGRAAKENGNAGQARKDWKAAAQQRNFYGFLAADRLDQPYNFSNEMPKTNQKKVQAPALVRVAMLRHLGEQRLAWNEWNWLLWHSTQSQTRELAQQALDNGWDDLAVQASIQARAWNVLAWRFPPAHKNLFMDAASRYQVDPWLTMAVARRESAFYPQARSGVGAVGLMQLMPATARKVSAQIGQDTPPDQLTRPVTNIELGTHYLAELLQRFNGNRVLALAAYNAGPHRVENWLADDNDKAVPADVWIESIPFHETRDYVQAVLTYRVLFIGLHDRKARTAQLLNHKEESSTYSVAMIDDEVRLPTE